jgi:hypothetical protein
VEVAVLVLLGRHHARGGDGGLGYEVVRDSPVKIAVLEVVHALLLHTVGHADVHAVGGQNTVDLGEHLNCVGAGAISTEDGVEGALVDDGVESTVLVLKLAHVHLLVHERWVALLVSLSHLLHHGERDVNVVHMLVSILKHFLGET